MTPEESIAFMCLVLKHAELRPDYWAAAVELYGVPSASQNQKHVTQQKFKKLIEATGKYLLKDGKIIEKDGNDNVAAATPKGKARATPGSRAGKRKAVAVDADDNSDAVSATPSKKAKAQPVKKPVEKETKVEAEESDGTTGGDPVAKAEEV